MSEIPHEEIKVSIVVQVAPGGSDGVREGPVGVIEVVAVDSIRTCLVGKRSGSVVDPEVIVLIERSIEGFNINEPSMSDQCSMSELGESNVISICDRAV